MGAEMTATMIVWPRRCGHGGKVLELVEHFRPYWLARVSGRKVSAPVPAPDRVLAPALALVVPAAGAGDGEPDLSRWAGKQITVLRYGGCVLDDLEVQRARQAGVLIEVVDVDGCTRPERSI